MNEIDHAKSRGSGSGGGDGGGVLAWWIVSPLCVLLCGRFPFLFLDIDQHLPLVDIDDTIGVPVSVELRVL